jgi:DEAD/DEAH box helicase domain-containing protein
MPHREVEIRAIGGSFDIMDESGKHIGELSYPIYPDFNKPAIFIYDGYEGGVGLTRRCFDMVEDLFKATLSVIEECPCDIGCPSCVHDPQCGSGNQPLDKEGAKFLLHLIFCP